LGGLRWEHVRRRIEAAVADLDGVAVTIYEPAGAPAEERMVRNREVPWELIDRIGVQSQGVYTQVSNQLSGSAHRPRVEIRREWYY
jgi:hypothetical protein